MFAKGCCTHGGVMFFMQKQFYKWCLQVFVPSSLWRTYCINWCLLKMHMSKKNIAYVEGNPPRIVQPLTFLKQCCALGKGICTCLFCCFYLVFMLVLAETMYLCRTVGGRLRMHSGCFCYRNNKVWFWKEHGLVSFADMKCQKYTKRRSQHNQRKWSHHKHPQDSQQPKQPQTAWKGMGGHRHPSRIFWPSLHRHPLRSGRQ